MLKSLRRFFGLMSGKPKASAPPESSFEQTLEELRRYIEADVSAGFSPRDEIAQFALDAIAYERQDVENLRPHAEHFTATAFRDHAVRQASWPITTDCDRLDAAFAALEAEGVISRQNFSCCGTCGAGEIFDEIDAAKAAGQPAKGYAFYHMQDTESAVDGHGLHLNYGACEDTEEAAVAVGHQIVARLQEHGLQTDWDGRIERRIGVSLDWKRRRPDLLA